MSRLATTGRLLLVVCLAGCGAPRTAPPAEPSQAAPGPSVGGDRDAHGCIGSAGYRWCERTSRCERPWELAKAQGFANSAEAYEKWCSAPATD